MRVLLVEDEKDLADLIAEALKKRCSPLMSATTVKRECTWL